MTAEQCVHVPVSPGQAMCRCEDTRMHLELLVSRLAESQRLLCEHVARLERRLYLGTPEVLDVPAAARCP